MNLYKRKPIDLHVDAKIINTDEWVRSLNVTPGSTVSIRINAKNNSKYLIGNVFLRDILPVGTSFINGSVMLVDKNHTTGTMIDDSIMSLNGYNLGTFEPGASKWVYFKVNVNETKGVLSNVVRISSDFPNSSREFSNYVIVM